MGFTSLGLSAPILKAVQEKGYDTPSPIQAQAIPAVLEGKDVMAAAQTGTGKTAGFVLPILEKLSHGDRARPNHVRALILTPTRELAAQILENAEAYSKHTRLRSTVVFGGVKINPQLMALRKGTDVLVATPGRLLDLYSQNAVKFSQLEVLVLDEADRMLDMGFFRDIKRILDILPKNRQNLLFSATFSDEIRQLAKGLVNNPVEISVTPANSTARTVEQCIYPADKKKKPAILSTLIKEGNWRQVLVFSRTKHGANKLSHFLNEEGITAAPIHGNKSQGARTKALADFKSGEVRVLVATDIAARGIDIPQLPQVVNFDLPNVAEDYVHRIGRTGRAGETGKAISLVCADEADDLFGIERLIQQVLPRIELKGFKPSIAVPERALDTRPMKAKKPKRPSAPTGGRRSSSYRGNGDKAVFENRQSRQGGGQQAQKAEGNGEGQARREGSARNGNANSRNGNRNGNSNTGNRGANASGQAPSRNKPQGNGAQKPAGSQNRKPGGQQRRRPSGNTAKATPSAN
ncbi:DEAD/DEAH box helicase [Enterovibrio sp. ZSDZ42]|uniref:ATP-dependent RNA helicase RhlE n=1 Tax=Enterovibrio gelatinilyticus TaxID=2899819 RepID=A0ABT5QZN5_9GAMM|nr:DEAD/DEAH box helicase [Enterovibrio sp. ZSDZ42]MDD1793380.1 DEAD/DEAH box helicase [Enterovibrio sp. ZSDZ42]